MLEEIKKIQGINHNEFDTTIDMWIEAAKLDLKSIGIVDFIVDSDDNLIQDAIITYVLSSIDVVNSEMYKDAYRLKKDKLRHYSEYTEVNDGI